MIHLVYVLLIVTIILLVIAGYTAFHDRRKTLIILAVAVLIAVTIAFLTLHRINGEITKDAYARVRAASARDPGTDAMAQWALSDNVITVTEYAAIADAYRRDTGRDISREKTK